MKPDVIVLGVGAMGSAACFHLAHRGAKVLGLERFHVAHDRGSSHGQSRVIRRAYAEGSFYVPLMGRAYQLWDALAERTGRELFHRSGLVYYGPPESEMLASVENSSRIHGIPLERPSPEEAAERFPMYRPREGNRVLLEPDAGWLAAEPCIEAHVQAARELGAVIREGETVLEWSAGDRRVRVRTDRETHEAAGLVITAGAWSAGLLADLGLPLEVRRVPLVWFPCEPGAHGEGTPCFLFELPGGHVYGFPAMDPWGVKMAEHLPKEVVEDPLQLDREIRDEDLEPLHAARREVLPLLGEEPGHSAVCMYTMTPDEHFLVDHHPAHPNVVLAAGFSGHGFKFAPAVGQALAGLLLEGATGLPVDFLGLSRLQG